MITTDSSSAVCLRTPICPWHAEIWSTRFVHIDVDIPDAIAGLIASGQDPARAALEALAIEGYRGGRLSEYDVQQLLGFETRMQVHAFLKDHGVYLQYGIEELEHDIREADRMLPLIDAHEGLGKQRAE